jgi:tight adherence protein C
VSRLAVAVALLVFFGVLLLLSTSRRVQPPRLVDRLAPFHPRVDRAQPRLSLTDLVGPVAVGVGNRLAALFGVSEPLALKLQRVHDQGDPTQFRIRQFTVTVAVLLASTAAVVALGVAPLVAAAAILGATMLTALVIEQRLVQRSATWQINVLTELPVVAEQLGMLVSAGWSLNGAMGRIAERSHGCCARDLHRIGQRMRHGISEADALHEWAEVSGLEQVDRLVSVLSMHRQTSDLGRLIADEARSIRNDGHRRLIELLERRSQQVWIPVTIAALVPGSIVIAVPFIQVISNFSQQG